MACGQAGYRPPTTDSQAPGRFTFRALLRSLGFYTIIWPLFGAANQLLAALALLAVAAWLGNAGRNNKMFFVPMAFMLAATLTSLGITFYQKMLLIMKGGDIFAPAVQALLAVLLFVLAVVLAVKGVKTIVATANLNAA